MQNDRRDFICRSAKALTMASLASGMGVFGQVTALAQKVPFSRAAEVPNDYRALVCIFLGGGNDANNMIVPNHSDANVSNYAAYAAARAPQGLALPQSSLLPIDVPRIGNLTYGLHPSFGPVTGGINNGLHGLWAQGKLAFVTNIGTLVMPLTRQQYQTNSGRRPMQLFSHTDQSNQQMNARSDVVVLSGWGGRIADRMTIPANPQRLIPMVNSIAGARVFTVGEERQPLAVGPAPTPLNSLLSLLGYNGTPAANARLAALQAGMDLADVNDLVGASNDVHREAIRISTTLNQSAEVTTAFPNTEIGNQLKQIARIIKNRSTLQMNRQIFFCVLDGFDTHTAQLTGQGTLFSRLSQASRAFFDEMTAQGIADKVTQFTLSDFNRTFNPGGSGTNVGSDHAWAGHAMVVGGAVVSSDFYGMNTTNGTPFPTLVNNGPDDADGGANARGRWIPTTSVEQYAATLSRWFGLSNSDLSYVYPNLENFPSSDLGFLMPPGIR